MKANRTRRRKTLGHFFAVVLMLLTVVQSGTAFAATNWPLIDGGGTNGLNANSTYGAVNPSLAVFNNALYAAWNESNGTATQIRVKKYNGTSWTSVDGGSLNMVSTSTASYPNLAVFNNALYVAWNEQVGSYFQIRVKKYNGGTSWASVDGGGTNGLNISSAKGAIYPNLAVFKSALYAAWGESDGTANQIRVKKYSGSSWTSADGGGTKGLNADTAKNANNPSLAVFDDVLYAAWNESNSGTNQIRVKKYNGTSWTSADGGSSNVLNIDPTRAAGKPNLIVFNNALYAAWDESNGTANQIRVKKYDGVSWTSADGGGADGLNVDSTRSASYPSLTVFNSTLYAAWNESNGTSNQIRIKKYDGTSWTNVDGGDTSGLNVAPEYNASFPKLAASGDALYAAWLESNGTANQLRAAKYSEPMTAPALTADSADNDTAHAIDLTFTDDATWRGAITAIKDGSTTLQGTDYTVSAGKISINAGVFNASSHSITVVATGYSDAAVTQVIITAGPAGGIISTVAGTGTSGYNGDGRDATTAQLKTPTGVTTDSAGNLYITDFANFRIRKVDTSGTIKLVAGNGTPGYSGDGNEATSAQFSFAYGEAVDSAGNIYFADYGNNRIRKVYKSTGIIKTVAGTGTGGYSGDNGAATSAKLYNPTGVALDSAGNLYIADYSNQRIRKVNTSGIISTVAGTGAYGYSEDGGAATAAKLYFPYGVAVDHAGNLYIADRDNQRIRKVDTSGIISTVAGTGTAGYSGDGGTATSAQLNTPYGVAVDHAGNLYIADTYNSVVRKVDASGVISTVAGTGTTGYSGDGGPGASAQLDTPWAVAVDAEGDFLYIADTNNSRIRKLTLPSQASNTDLSGLALSSGTLSPTFAPGTTDYTASVANAESSITVTPTVSDTTVTVTASVYDSSGTLVSGPFALTSGEASPSLPLQVGSNPIRVTVTAQDGTTAKTYTVTATREAAPLTYSIAAIADQTTADLIQGYTPGTQELKAISVINTGTGDLTNLSASLGGTNANDFAITSLTATLTSGSSTTFTVKAKDGLTAGTYAATVTISAANMTNVTFTVTQVVNLPNAPANPQSLAATGGDRQVALNWGSVTEATYYNLYMSTVSGQFSESPIATVTYATYNVPNLTNGTTYFFVVKAGNPGGLSAQSNRAEATPATVPGMPTNVTAVAGDGQATIFFSPPADNGGNAVTGYEVTASSDGATATKTASPITITGLTNGTSYTFTVKAINGAGSSEPSAASNAVIPMSPSSDDDSSSLPSQPTASSAPQTTNTGVDVLVNGKVENAGTATTTEVNHQTVTTIVVDQKKLDDRLAAEDRNTVVTIPVDAKTDVVIGELNGQMVKNMETKQAVLEIKTEKASYTLPAQQINISAISDQIGKSVALQDIKVQIETAAPPADTVKIVEDAAEKGAFSLVVPPVNFTVRAIYEGTTIEISRFNAYVERTITIPEGVDPNKITTGVVVDPDGTVRHVPTKITMIDGKYYAVINSLTNSTYSVVWHPVEFKDVANHWSKSAVNDMGSRMIIEGIGNGMFSPDTDITRAEFAAIIVRGLGLKLESGATSFSDVKETDWFSGPIHTAYEYHLISGFEDGTFHPNDKITREQAMVIIAKAMTMTKLKSTLAANATDDSLQPFIDAAEASSWAKGSIADSVQAGIVSGRNGAELAPKAFITRAEVAAIVQRLLLKAELI